MDTRGTCPACGAAVLLWKDGLAGLHVAYAGDFVVVMCPGSRQSPTVIVATEGVRVDV